MSISDNIAHIHHKINQAERQYHRITNSVELLGVTKSQSIDKIKMAIDSGLMRFGENYLQESLKKMEALKFYPLEWHFIGTLQTNKTRAIAENFSWVHSVYRIDIAERLNNQRPKELDPLNICIQVNIENEKSKSGVALDELESMAFTIRDYDRLRLRGLMAIPAEHENFVEQRKIFKAVADAQRHLIARGLVLDTLSMGMSNDFIAAIAEGGTLVRIGEGIFGKRGY